MSNIILTNSNATYTTALSTPLNNVSNNTFTLPLLPSATGQISSASGSFTYTSTVASVSGSGGTALAGTSAIGTGATNTGTNATFNITVVSGAVTSVVLNYGGSGYVAGNTITIPAASLGTGGTGSIVITVVTVGTLNSGTLLANPMVAGTAAGAPIVLTSGTLSSQSSYAGSLEYNGYSPYFTPTGTQRGVMQAAQYYALNTAYTGTQATTAQSIFGLTNGVSLSSSTQYEFEMLIEFSKTAGATSHNFSLGFGGGATLNNISYNTFLNYNNTGFTTAPVTAVPWFIQSASATAIISSIANANSYIFGLIKGIVSVNAGGTFNPQYTLSAAPGGAYTTAVGSYIKISPLAASGSNVSIGAWS
jgi:hypothetical protein